MVFGVLAVALTVAVVDRHGNDHGVAPTAPAVAERTLRFEDRLDGAVTVVDAARDKTIETVTGQQGFLRGMLRAFARERRQDGIGSHPPLVLTAYADGRVLLSDPQTGRRIDLEAFGSTNVLVFTKYLPLPAGQGASHS